MKTEPRIKTIPEQQLIGLSVTMSLTENRTGDLWKTFMTQMIQKNGPVSAPKYSIQVYEDVGYFNSFDPNKRFTKWACIAAEDCTVVPEGFQPFKLESGTYAVFDYQGTPADFPKMAQWIYGQWLPSSPYQLDHRPHFESLGKAYKKDSPDSKETVWIPIKPKSKEQ